MIQTETNIDALINSAFDEAECASHSKDRVSCGGKIRAYSTTAHCGGGFLCETHYKHYIDVLRPAHLDSFAAKGYLYCWNCNFEAFTVDEYSKVYPL